MQIKNIFNSYVYISIEGFYIEKIINICKKNQLELGRSIRKSATLIYAEVKTRDFKDIAHIARDNKCRVKIIQKRGLPFKIKKYRKRKIFAVALIVLCVTIIALSKFIWKIEVIGNEDIPEAELLKIAQEEGLDVGKIKKSIELNKVIDKIRAERADISWVGIKISGTNAKIEVVKAKQKPQLINENEFCNIVALKDAIIEKVEAQNGTQQVNKGDEVTAGTVLIAGRMEGKYTGTRYVHSRGIVLGRVKYTEHARAYLKENKKIRTGKVESKYALKVNKFQINFFKRLSKFEIYDTIRTDNELKISSNFYLPFQIVKNTNYEVREEQIEHTIDEAKNIAVDEAKKKLEKKIGGCGDIVNEYIDTDENEEYVDVQVTYEVLESIGTEEKIAL